MGPRRYKRTTTGMDWQNVATYVYDETNRLVDGKNEQGERSLYTYNGLGVRVGRELIMQDNTHGYTDFHSETPSVETGIDKPEVVKESYVVDYTTATRETLTMNEEGGFAYRWVYGLDRLSVKITSEGTNWWGQNVKQDILKDYTHQDRLGSTTNLTDKFGRVVGRADYNEWGEMTYREALNITSSYRRIWPQSSYTGHDWDDVLGMYYAKARFYSAEDKRFVAMDPVKGSITDPMSLVAYVYCVDNPLRWVDPLGLRTDHVDLELGNGSTSSPSPAVPTPTAPDTSGAVQGAGTSKFAAGTVWVVEPTEGLNLRTEADVNSKRICGLSKGTQVISLGETEKKGDNLWLKVSVNGQVGWVVSKYLQSAAPAADQIGSELLEKVREPSDSVQSMTGVLAGAGSALASKSLEELAAEKVLEEISQPVLDVVGTLIDIFGNTAAFLVGAASAVVQSLFDVTVGNVLLASDFVANVQAAVKSIDPTVCWLLNAVIPTPEIISANSYASYVNATNDLSEHIAQSTGYPAAYYAGRMAADELMRLIGIAANFLGTSAAGVGLAASAASVKIALASTVSGSVPVLIVDSALLVSGLAMAVCGEAIAAAGASVSKFASERYDHDSSKYSEYMEKAGCNSAPSQPDSINFDSKQLGKKYGEHRKDYPDMKEYTDYRDRAYDVFNSPEQIIYDDTCGEFYYIQGNDLLRIKSNGDFVSMYHGVNSDRVVRAISQGGIIWPKP